MITPLRLCLLLVTAFAPCFFSTQLRAEEGITSHPFGKTAHGQEITLYTLTNGNGLSVSIMNYGATVVKIMAPDSHGQMENVALGFDHFTPYLTSTSFFGATVGRFANRIDKGRFTINHTPYQLRLNDKSNTLHGGPRGFDKQVWKREEVEPGKLAIRFSLLSPDGDEGFPGNVFTSVTFELTSDNQLRISYQATTDKPTVINLTNHTYFNLAGAGHGTVLEEILTLHADAFLPVNAELIPTGEIKDVEGTAWDFREPTPIGAHLKEAGGKPVGYDTNFVLKKGFFSDWALAAEVEDPTSGRTLKIYTDQPGIQFYSGNQLNGKDGYSQYSAFALETQHYPDSPNHANFPSTLLVPGQPFESSTVLEFGVK